MQLSLKYFPRYYLDAILTYTLYFNTIMVGLGKVRKIFAHVEIIEVNLIKCLSFCL